MQQFFCLHPSLASLSLWWPVSQNPWSVFLVMLAFSQMVTKQDKQNKVLGGSVRLVGLNSGKGQSWGMIPTGRKWIWAPRSEVIWQLFSYQAFKTAPWKAAGGNLHSFSAPDRIYPAFQLSVYGLLARGPPRLSHYERAFSLHYPNISDLLGKIILWIKYTLAIYKQVILMSVRIPWKACWTRLLGVGYTWTALFRRCPLYVVN